MQRLVYANLEGSRVAREITTKQMAQAIGCNEKTYRNKICGRSDFTWSETYIMKQTFFPDLTYDYLMKRNGEAGAKSAPG